MNIPPTLMLTVGITAGALFLAVFAVASIITFRNRRTIQKYYSDRLRAGDKQNR